MHCYTPRTLKNLQLITEKVSVVYQQVISQTYIEFYDKSPVRALQSILEYLFALWSIFLLIKRCNILLPDVQVLMGTLLYMRHGVQNSPYAYLLDNIHWAEVEDMFTRDACALLGLSVESPLSVV